MSGWKPRYLYATVISNKKQIPQNLATPAYGLISFPEFIASIFLGSDSFVGGDFQGFTVCGFFFDGGEKRFQRGCARVGKIAGKNT